MCPNSVSIEKKKNLSAYYGRKLQQQNLQETNI